MIAWGQIINTIGFGKIYGSSWAGEYPFINIVGDVNDFDKRVSDDGGTIEGHICQVNNINNTVSQ